jgi:two-component system LytT family response regulator
MLRVVIADDELLARKRMKRLAEALDDVDVVAVCSSAEEVLALLEDEHADVLLLDIDMPGLSGVDAAALLPADGPRVIFTTAHPQHALAAFDLGAADYLLKPIDVPRLRKALDRVRPTESEGPADTRLGLPTRKGVRLVDVSEVHCAVFDGSALVVHLHSEALFVDWTLSELARRLPESSGFVRCHRRALVNLHQVTLLEPQDSGGYLAVTVGGQRVAVSRQAARGLRRRLGLAKR